MKKMRESKIPKLLAPAGSHNALLAAISAGADEIYFGAKSFNARYSAENFDENGFLRAIELCRIHGRLSNITMNTLLSDREIPEALELVYTAACHGADAFIVQDIALARLIKQSMPEVVLHASTQCACHNLDGAKRLYEAGFSRIVLARELPYEDIAKISSYGEFETEVFVHGALCVSHSGQCLFSSCVGGRSGNRGMCAQPCRMEYELCGKKEYFLSLRDLSLAKHIRTLSTCGVTSLKIEGRMKSPEYVYGVCGVYKNLLTEGRNATDNEQKELENIFSRSGSTDKYFTRGYLSDNKDMYGVRSEKDKEKTRAFEKALVIPKPKREISAVCSFRENEIPSLSLLCHDVCVTAEGKEPLTQAKNQSATEESIAKNLTKMGDTPFNLCAENISMSLGEKVFFPVSAINELRRSAVAALTKELTKDIGIKRTRIGFYPTRNAEQQKAPSVRLYLGGADKINEKIARYHNVESVVLPLAFFESKKSVEIDIPFGVLFPRVMFEGEEQRARENLKNAKESGAVFCEISNIGHIDAVKEAELKVYGGIGLNIYNSPSAEYYASLGISSLVLSPELKLGAVRDIAKSADVKYCLYAKGRLPLMVLESCIIRAKGMCRKKQGGICGVLKDRVGASFPVYSQGRLSQDFPCRNIIYNSVELDLLSKKELYTSGIDVLCISGEQDGIPM